MIKQNQLKKTVKKSIEIKKKERHLKQEKQSKKSIDNQQIPMDFIFQIWLQRNCMLIYGKTEFSEKEEAKKYRYFLVDNSKYNCNFAKLNF